MSIQFHTKKDLVDALAASSAPVTLTTQLTTLTHTAPSTPDYAIAALTTTTPYGFASSDEGHSVLKTIANLQTRMTELETRLKAVNILI